MRLTVDELSGIFRKAARSVFRLETLQEYNVPSERPKLERFLAGQEKPAEPSAEWRELIRTSVGAGVTWQKVKLLLRPLSDYQRFSLAWGAPANSRAGMEYRVIDITDREVELPRTDFWLIDDKTVVVINYHEDGSPNYIEQLESGDVEEYLRWRDTALKESIPLSEYRA